MYMRRGSSRLEEGLGEKEQKKKNPQTTKKNPNTHPLKGLAVNCRGPPNYRTWHRTKGRHPLPEDDKRLVT